MTEQHAVSDPAEAPAPAATLRPARPRGVTWLARLTFLLGILSLLRLRLAVDWWGFWEELLPIPPLYLVISSLVWAVAGLALAWGLWRGRSWAPFFARIAALAFAAYYWVDRLLISNPEARAANWPFALTVTILGVIFTFGVLSRRQAKAFFGENHGD